MKDDTEKAVAEHVTTITGVRSSQEFQALEEELRRAHEESAHLCAELATKRSLRVDEQASRERAE